MTEKNEVYFMGIQSELETSIKPTAKRSESNQNERSTLYYYTMFVLGKLRRRYMNQIPEDKQDILRSMRTIAIQDIVLQVYMSLAGGTFLTGLLLFSGVSDIDTGIIIGLTGILVIFQLFGTIVSMKYKKRKLFVCLCVLIRGISYTLMFFVHCVFSGVTGMFITVSLFCMGGVANAFQVPTKSDWELALIPRFVRKKFYSSRITYSTILAPTAALFAGYMLDRFKAFGNIGDGFVLLGVVVGVLSLVSFIVISMTMEPKKPKIAESPKEMFKEVFKNKEFYPTLIALLLWTVSGAVINSFFSVYIISDLNFSYMYINLITFTMIFLQMLVLKVFGKKANRMSNEKWCKLSGIILAASYFMRVFLIPANAIWFYPVLMVAATVGNTISNITIYTMQSDLLPQKGREAYFAIIALVNAFAASMGMSLGAAIMKINDYLGAPVYGQQILSILSAILFTSTAIYIGKMRSFTTSE